MCDHPLKTVGDVRSVRTETSKVFAGKRKQRLDEILIHEGLISEAEIKEALLRQKAYGGRFGSQLLCLGYIDEAALVKALSTQFGCQGVVLSELKIPQAIVSLVPKKVALARKVIPFEHDPQHNILKIACEDPTDQNLIKELNFVVCGHEIRLYVAAEIALNTALANYYLGRDMSWHDVQLREISSVATEISKQPVKTQVDQSHEKGPAILLITDDEQTSTLLKSLLERDNCRVVITHSSDEATGLLGKEKFHTIFLKDTVSVDHIDLVSQMRKVSPETVIRHYERASSLLLGKVTESMDADLFLKDLDLLTSLLSCTAELPVNHSRRVAQYAGDLCCRLGLAHENRFRITHAAYVHDLAKFYYRTDQTIGDRSVIRLTTKLMKSLDYSPEVREIVGLMYINLPKSHFRGLPAKVLAGNILTVVDLFCHSTSPDDPLSLDEFDPIKRKLRDLAGKLLLPDVVEAFIEMIQEKILSCRTFQKAIQVMIYAEDSSPQQVLESRLKNEGFGIISESSPTSFIELYKRSEPDMIILVVPGDAEKIKSFIGMLIEDGINFMNTPTFLVTDSTFAPLASLLGQGVEDIVSLDDNLNLLFSKIHTLETKISARAKIAAEIADGTSGSLGRLADMDLIRLLKILGPCRKTVRITVQSKSPSAPTLVLYLDHGQISFAQCKDFNGAEAIYEALTWSDGSWTVDSVAPEDLPPPNNLLANESILMEGCRLMNEKIKRGQLL